MTLEIRALSASEAEAHRSSLADILVSCVRGGASIGFMLPFETAEAERWWDGVFRASAAGDILIFGGFLDGDLVGSAQLGLAFPPNQQHRAEVKKLIVSPAARGRGVAAELMAALSDAARARGRTLLTLDTATGSDAERLYRRLGWSPIGIIPKQALYPDGSFCDAAWFWKAP